jgi:DNA-binding MurR/RpiR family transcriptional regulator
MPTRLSLRIQDCLPQLSASERSLANLLLEREDDVLSHSAAELARLSGVSKATATRFFRHLGYQDFTEVRLQAREERNRIAPDHRERVPASLPAPDTGIDAYIRLEVENVTHSLELIRADDLTQAATAIAEATTVWLLGGTAEQGLARHLRLVLARHRGSVRLLVEGDGLAEDLAMVGPRDAVLVISSRPRPRSFERVISYLKTTRTRIVHLTPPDSAAWARRSGAYVLLCRTGSRFSQKSYSSFLSVGQILVAVMVQRLGAPAQRRINLIEEIHEEIGDLED